MFRPALFALAAAGLALALGGPAAAQPKKKDPPKGKQPATPPEDLAVAPGFKVELLYTADPATEGSWINLAKDDKGRLIIGGQQGQPVLRAAIEGGKVAKMEKLDLPISQTMGLLHAHGSLYVMGSGPGAGYGLFRCTDADGDGKYEQVKLLKDFKSGGEHGAHAVLLGPDKNIWVLCGNHTDLPPGLADESPHRNFREDHLLPRQWDGNGHATGRLAPGGYVLKTDPDGTKWDLVLGGFRNAYDMAFTADGELFAFDSDMEWDWGMPWYRPTRVNHLTSAAEFGWRSGTGKWPSSYPDSLPATADVGLGSPTGVANGIGAKFPAKYQKAIYLCDWTYGRLIAVHLTPTGASYAGTLENFVAPAGLDGKSPKKPLNLTDAVVGADGAMYFTVGGRNTQAALYRVTYTGSEPTAPADLHDAAGADARKLRHELERFHGKADPKAVAFAWPHLASDDRFIRYAARVAIEWQPAAEWKDKAVAETNPNAALTALLALARTNDRAHQPALLAALEKFPLAKLTDAQKIDKLRVLGLSFLRQGPPVGEPVRKLVAELDAEFPGPDERVNRELAQVLIYLQSPKVLGKCLKLMADAKTPQDRLHYLFHLRTLPIGFWTLAQRTEYLNYWTKDRSGLARPADLEKWFAEAARPYSDGNSYANFLKNFLREYVTTLSPDEVKALEPAITAIDKAAAVTYETKPRPFVKKWAAADLAAVLEKPLAGRNFENGRQAYLDTNCAKCHRLGDLGGAVGPDLTAVGSRYDRRVVLEAILEPSKVLSEQYENVQISTLAGQAVVGRIVDETDTTISVQTDPLDPKRVVLKKADIDTRKPSKVSPMPANLIDGLSDNDILDLLAFLESAGNRRHPVFGKK